MSMAMNTTESGRTTRQMAMEFTSMQVELDMRDIGRMINKKDKGMKFGLKDQNIKENT